RLKDNSFGHCSMIMKHVRTSILLLLALTAVTGAGYPLLITGMAQFFFPFQANGSLVRRDGHPRGSMLIGQPFSEPRYFWSRPSSTPAFPYNAGASSGSNQGPLNPSLLDAVRQRISRLSGVDSSNTQPVPVDLVTASGSGLDPHISVMAAHYQVSRVARARNLPEEVVWELVRRRTEGRQFGLLGEPRINVLLLNMDLDEATPHAKGQ
ncbi:MAG: kdpC, partial [Bacteroidetes bacterium]|nr:kdpC [Bacteroidota bacterium]